jgi:hypothetical protein
LRATFRLLWRDEPGGPECRQSLREVVRGAKVFREAKIAHERLTVSIQENVTRLEVAVYDSSGMGMFDGARHFRHDAHAVARSAGEGRAEIAQAAARRELHAEVGQTLCVFTYFVDWQNVRMVETRRGLHLATEALDPLAVIRTRNEHAFQRNNPAGMALPCAINHPHPAAPELVQNLVITETPIPRWEVILGEGTSECLF